MNSLPDIEEVKDQSRNKGSSAVRVYRMLPPLTKNQRKGSQGYWVLRRKGRREKWKIGWGSQPVCLTERKSKSSRDTKSKTKRKVSVAISSSAFGHCR